jgi:hypothetical protein
VIRITFRIVAVALLSAIVVTGAGACSIPASTMHPAMGECHHEQIPSQGQPGDYRCCVARHPSALLTPIFLPPAAVQAKAADAIHTIVAASDCAAPPNAMAPSGESPGIVILRI